MTEVYLLWHVRSDDTDCDDGKLIGVYAADASAKAAIERLRDKPGFGQHPDGFMIEPYTLDKDHWTEGFISSGGEADG